MTKYLYAAALALLLTGCYKDKGNYDYKDLYEPTLDMPYYTYVVNGETLRLEAKLETVAPRTQDDYTFEWYIQDKKVGEGQVLEIPNYQGINGNRSDNRVIITDKISGVRFIEQFAIVTSMVYGTGWLILADNGGQTELNFVREIREFDEDGEGDNVIGQTFEWFPKVVSGLPSSPKGLFEHWTTNTSTLGQIAVLCDNNQLVELSGDKLTKVSDLQSEFTGQTFPSDLNADKAFYLLYNSYVYNDNGVMYGRKNNDPKGFQTGRYLQQPVYPAKGMQVGYTALSNSSKSYQGLIFDTKNNRYLLVSDYESIFSGTYYDRAGDIVTVTSYKTDKGDNLALEDLGSDVKLLGCGSWGASGYGAADYYSLIQKGADYYMQKFTLKISYSSSKNTHTVSASNYIQKPITWGNLLSEGMPMKVFYDEQNIMFFAKGNKLYFNYCDDSTPIEFISYDGADVVSIDYDVCAYGWWDVGNKQLGVGLSDGRFIIYDVDIIRLGEVANKTEEPTVLFEKSGLGNIKSVIYKLGAPLSSRDY